MAHRDLWFALWPYRPAWLFDLMPVDLRRRDFSTLTTREASEALEMISSLQIVRTALAAIPVLVVAGLADAAGLSARADHVLWFMTFALVLMVPSYGVLLGVVHQVLRRSRHPGQPVGQAHRRGLVMLRLAPLGACLLALAIAYPLPVGV